MSGIEPKEGTECGGGIPYRRKSIKAKRMVQSCLRYTKNNKQALLKCRVVGTEWKEGVPIYGSTKTT